MKLKNKELKNKEVKENKENADSVENFQTNDSFIRKTVQKYMAPSVTALIGTTAVTVANSIIVGNYIGADALAALNVVNPIYFAFATLGALVNVGAATNASVCIGKNDDCKAHSYANIALFLTLALSALMTVAGIFCFPQLINALGTTERIAPYAVEYGRVLVLGGTAVSFMYYPFHFLKTDGRPRQGTCMFLVMLAADLLFCLLFVGKFSMGMEGIALSFVLSTLLGDIYGMCALHGKSSGFKLEKAVNVRNSILEIVKTGSSVALNNLCNIFRTIALNYIILHALSEEGLTVFAVIGTINNFSNAVISGIAQTITPLIGVFYGEMDNISIKTTVGEALRKGTRGTLAITALTCVFAKWIGVALGVEKSPMLVFAVIAFAISFLPGMLNSVYIYYYFTTEKIALANLLAFLRGFAIIVPVAWGFFYWEAPRMIWISFAVSEFLTLFIIWGIAKIECSENQCLQGILMLDSRYEEQDKYLAFSVENTENEAAGAATKIFSFCKEKGMSSKATMTISLAVEEMLLIIFDHCLKDMGTQYADVRIMMAEEKIVLYMRCAGKLFDPIVYYQKRKAEALEKGEVLADDSLGIEVIVKKASDVIFNRTFGMNNLTILIQEKF